MAAGNFLLLSAQDLAAELRVSVRTIRRFHDQGKLPRPLKIGRAIRWPRATIVEWLAMDAPDRSAFEEMRNGRRPAHNEKRKSPATAPTAAGQVKDSHHAIYQT